MRVRNYSRRQMTLKGGLRADQAARVKLLKTIRADRSDTFIFDKAAEAGEWAVSGAFVFAHRDPTALTGKARAAFRGGFLGVDSFGWSTLVRIVEASDSDRTVALERLAAHLVQRFGAPDLRAARLAAEEEIAFAASLCEHPPGMLIAVSRRHENGLTYEAFRTLQSNAARWQQAPVFAFVKVPDDADIPDAPIDLAALANAERS
jgi:Family of unknown function (DUF6505)